MSLIYEDQPISPQADREFVFVPERIKSIRSLGRGVAAYRQPRELIFLHQAKLLVDYEDDYEYRQAIPAYQPTYESLTDEQLRGYFGFRTRVRKGVVERAPAAYVFLYLYELINLIGVDDPQAGFFRLSDFMDQYGKLDPMILPRVDQWIIDYVLYYGLDPELFSDCKAVQFDKQLSVLLKAAGELPEDMPLNKAQKIQVRENGCSEKEKVFRAMFYLSGFRNNRLPSYLSEPEVFMRSAANSFIAMCEYYKIHRKQTLIEDYIGKKINKPVRFFVGAVFRDAKEHEETLLTDGTNKGCYDVRLSDITTYHFENGIWSVKTYPRDFRNRRFTELLQTVDCVIREMQGDQEAKLGGLQTKWVRKLIRDAITKSRREIEEEKARHIEIHLDYLDGIRRDATLTMEKLITEDEMGNNIAQISGEETAEEKIKENQFDFTAEERKLLQCLAAGEDARRVDLDGNILSVLVDSINEKLFDEFGDTVIEDGVVPRLFEDYLEDIREMVL